jgi:hypothetical protein
MNSPDILSTPSDVRFQLSLLRLLSTGETPSQVEEMERLLSRTLPAA